MSKAKLKIKKGDNVVVITGKDKGKSGEVLRVIPSENRAVVKGVNVVKRHTRPTQADPAGGIKTHELSIHISNIALADPKDGKASRVGYKIDKDGNKTRIAKKSGQTVEQGKKAG